MASRPAPAITHHPPGVLPDPPYTPGDFFLVSDPTAPDALSELIQAGERAEVGKDHPLANLIHSGGILTPAGDIMEAEAAGIQRNHIEKYRDKDIYLVHVTATKQQRALCVAKWETLIGMEYDVIGFVGLALQRLTGWQLLINDAHGLICSAAVSFGLLAFVVAFDKPYQQMTPAGLALHFNFPVPEPPVPLGTFARFLDGLRAICRAISPFR